jgi:phosphoglycerate dehydrogenase-like enzyme
MATREPRLVHLAVAVDPAELATAERQLRRAGLMPYWLASQAELVAHLPRIEFLLVGRPAELDWSPAAVLRLVQVAGTGVDGMFPARGLPSTAVVANTRGAHVHAVRDHVFGLLLNFTRGLPELAQEQARGQWSRRVHRALRGMTLTVVGLGAVGRAIAATANSFELRVRAVARTPRQEPGIERVFGPEELTVALSGADVAVICVPLTPLTRGFIGEAALDALGARGLLIDVSRGGVVDEAALERALRTGRLAFAARDVFALEPLPATSSLWSCPNLVVTPHVAGLTPDYLERVIDVFTTNIELVLRGQDPSTKVSPELGY